MTDNGFHCQTIDPSINYKLTTKTSLPKINRSAYAEAFLGACKMFNDAWISIEHWCRLFACTSSHLAENPYITGRSYVQAINIAMFCDIFNIMGPKIKDASILPAKLLE